MRKREQCNYRKKCPKSNYAQPRNTLWAASALFLLTLPTTSGEGAICLPQGSHYPEPCPFLCEIRGPFLIASIPSILSTYLGQISST